MDDSIRMILVVTTGLSAALTVTLAVIKYTHRAVQRYRGVRTAYYTTAIGEMLSRRVLPSRPRRGWAEDPLFHDAVADYRLMLTGQDRAFVDALIQRLGIDDILVARTRRKLGRSSRLRALSSLVNLADRSHRAVFESLIDDRNPHVRVNAVRGLARIGAIDAIPRILDVALRVKPWEAARTADALVEMGPAAVQAVVDWIDRERSKPAPSVDVVSLACRLLGLIGDPEAEPVLISLLGSSVPEWRISAASALEHTGTDAATEPIRIALHDDDWRVRARAATAAGAMPDPVFVEEVAQLLTDEKWWVRQNAATALARLPGGTDRLLAALDSPDHFAADAALNQLTASGALTRLRPQTSGA